MWSLRRPIFRGADCESGNKLWLHKIFLEFPINPTLMSPETQRRLLINCVYFEDWQFCLVITTEWRAHNKPSDVAGLSCSSLLGASLMCSLRYSDIKHIGNPSSGDTTSLRHSGHLNCLLSTASCSVKRYKFPISCRVSYYISSIIVKVHWPCILWLHKSHYGSRRDSDSG